MTAIHCLYCINKNHQRLLQEFQITNGIKLLIGSQLYANEMYYQNMILLYIKDLMIC